MSLRNPSTSATGTMLYKLDPGMPYRMPTTMVGNNRLKGLGDVKEEKEDENITLL